ncbi:FemAB family PEP-CTERM system-associated protein [Beggiatoa alba]|nr:FemAB family PEP-CTERM system-associated protein [Beggiatoa alba]
MTERLSSLTIHKFSSTDASRWNAYVMSCPEATFFHKAEWAMVIEKAFRHTAHYLYAEQGGEIKGVLPLVHTQSFLFGNSLSSTPFCVYGGVIANNDVVRIALEDAAQELAHRLDVDYLEMRNVNPAQIDWPVKDLYVTFRKEIDPDLEVNMLAIPRKQRAMVRKGIKAGLVSEIEGNTDRFFDIYATSVRNHGTPVFPRQYFKILKDIFADDCEILTITKGRRVVSTVMSFYFRDQVLPYYAGGTLEARRVKGFDFMYWEVMRRSCEKGIRIFDYGRSKKGTGSYNFKKNWGFEPESLHYQYRLVKAGSIPDKNPLNPKYRMFINMWKRLPLPIANMVGPLLSRSLG